MAKVSRPRGKLRGSRWVLETVGCAHQSWVDEDQQQGASGHRDRKQRNVIVGNEAFSLLQSPSACGHRIPFGRCTPGSATDIVLPQHEKTSRWPDGIPCPSPGIAPHWHRNPHARPVTHRDFQHDWHFPLGSADLVRHCQRWWECPGAADRLGRRPPPVGEGSRRA